MTGRHHREGHIYEDHIVDFVTAPPGWEIVVLHEDGTVGKRPLPGWLVLEEVAYRDDISYPRTVSEQPCRPWRSVVAAAHGGPALWVANESVPDFWRIAGPGEPPPTPVEIRTELTRRAQTQRALHSAGISTT